MHGAVQERFELMTGTLDQVPLQFCDVLDIVPGHRELDSTSVLHLTPFEERVEVRDALPVVIYEHFQIGMLYIVTRDDTFPRFNVSVMEKLVLDYNGVHRCHA